MPLNHGPYLREDLAVGRRERINIESNWTNITGPARRLLATVDALYILLDERNAAMEAWRDSAGELRRENASLKRTTFQHEALPEDVQTLREEAASWKDEYARVLGLAKSLQVQVDNQMSVISKLLASRKKWRRRARRSDAVVRNQVHMIREMAERHAEETAGLQRQVTLKGDDDALVIRLAAEDFQDWLREEKIIGLLTHGDLAKEYLRGDVAMTEIRQAKRELS